MVPNLFLLHLIHQKKINDNVDQYEAISSYKRLIGRLIYLNNKTQYYIHFHRDLSTRLLRFFWCWLGRLHRYYEINFRCLLINWHTSHFLERKNKQNTISKSFYKVEYGLLTTATCEIQWILYMLCESKFNWVKPLVLYCDNQSVFHIADNFVFHEITKYLKIDCHLIREKFQASMMRLLPITKYLTFFTKSLLPKLFSFLKFKLNLINIYQSSNCKILLSNNEAVRENKVVI